MLDEVLVEAAVRLPLLEAIQALADQAALVLPSSAKLDTFLTADVWKAMPLSSRRDWLSGFLTCMNLLAPEEQKFDSLVDDIFDEVQEEEESVP
ncbi:hypothetical protein KW797_02275 [Candidatus Parcubacteria bacterium]|nr:hypothetical protein [Candidatus Parcubacteria bacterium]